MAVEEITLSRGFKERRNVITEFALLCGASPPPSPPQKLFVITCPCVANLQERRQFVCLFVVTMSVSFFFAKDVTSSLFRPLPSLLVQPTHAKYHGHTHDQPLYLTEQHVTSLSTSIACQLHVSHFGSFVPLAAVHTASITSVRL